MYTFFECNEGSALKIEQNVFFKKLLLLDNPSGGWKGLCAAEMKVRQQYKSLEIYLHSNLTERTVISVVTSDEKCVMKIAVCAQIYFT